MFANFFGGSFQPSFSSGKRIDFIHFHRFCFNVLHPRPGQSNQLGKRLVSSTLKWLKEQSVQFWQRLQKTNLQQPVRAARAGFFRRSFQIVKGGCTLAVIESFATNARAGKPCVHRHEFDNDYGILNPEPRRDNTRIAQGKKLFSSSN
jgi:hypothetical protein